MMFLRHLNFALIIYYVTQFLVGAETKNIAFTDVAATTEFKIQNHTQDVTRILNGFTSFFVNENMGTLSVFGRQAFSIAAQRLNSTKQFHPIIACGTLGRGKFIVIANSTFLNVKSSDKDGQSSQRTLLLNAVKWSRLVNPSLKKPFIGFHRSCCKFLNNFFKHKKLNTSNIIKNSIKNLASLAKYDVIVANDNFSPHEIPIVLKYLKNGGNLIMGQSARGKSSPGHFGSSYPANIISSQAGFVWKNSSDNLVFEENHRIPISINRLKHTHLLDAWSIIKNIPKELNATAKQAWATVESALVSISPNDPFWVINFPLPQTLHNVLKKAIFSS